VKLRTETCAPHAVEQQRFALGHCGQDHRELFDQPVQTVFRHGCSVPSLAAQGPAQGEFGVGKLGGAGVAPRLSSGALTPAKSEKLGQIAAHRNSSDPSVNNVGPVSDVEMFSSCHLRFYLERTIEICENSYVGFNHHIATRPQPDHQGVIQCSFDKPPGGSP
jgi:hypothetical protein